MVEIRTPIPVHEAVEKVMNYRSVGEKETVDFNDCDNRRLAEPIIATSHIPPFDRSPYDGFALRSVDTKENTSVKLKVIEHIGAGEVATIKLAAGEATRIMTGAQIPEGADSVVMFEKCDSLEEDGQAYISINHKIEANENIIGEGSEVKEGTLLVEAGRLINPGVKASLATFGYARVVVAKKPVVGVIATGTELLDVDEALEPGKIRNSNAYMIGAQVIQAGGEYVYLGKLADDFDPSYETIKKALHSVDILITTGGVSVGDFDLMPAIYEKLGANILFNKVAMRPGSVTTVAAIGDKLLFGLSGNPSACYVGFELFTRPIIQSLLFNEKPYLKRIQATLNAEFPKANPFSRFVRSYLAYEKGSVMVELAGMDKSNVVTSLAHTTCLMYLPGGTEGYTVGSTVEVLLINDTEGQAIF